MSCSLKNVPHVPPMFPHGERANTMNKLTIFGMFPMFPQFSKKPPRTHPRAYTRTPTRAQPPLFSLISIYLFL